MEFERAINESQRTLLVISPAYLAEGFSEFTNLLAQSYGLQTAVWPVIPLILHPVRMPPRLAILTSLDATDPTDWPGVIQRLFSALQRPIPPLATRPPCPYPGMIPFSEQDARYFFGRDREIQELYLLVRNQNLLFIIGPSGSGKSSLVFAGLVPELDRRQPGEWLVRTMRPGVAPIQTLDQLLVGDSQSDTSYSERLTALVGVSPKRHMLLIIDQFEELFTQVSPHEQARFIAALLELRSVEGCTQLIALRADFYAELLSSSLWPISPGQRIELAPLRREALRQAIEQPAIAAGVFLEAGLLERLLADAADEPGSLPLVQEIMRLLWDKMERRLITLHTYEQLGDQRHSGLAVAMTVIADATWAELSSTQRAIARRVFLRLVQFGEGRADTRRRLPIAALRAVGDEPSIFDQTLHHLVTHRLLILSGTEEGTDPQVDIAHEGLITQWPLLRQWLIERQAAEQTRRYLEAEAAAWMRLGRGRGRLLDAIELAEAKRWLASSDAAELGYSEALIDLVTASQLAIDEAFLRDRLSLSTVTTWIASQWKTYNPQRQLQLAQAIEVGIHHLERCDTIDAVSHVHRNLEVGELEGPASALLRSFSRLSQDVDAALNQGSAYNQRLALSALEDRLDGLLRELTRSNERYAARFRPIATRWRHIVADHIRTLAAEVERRQEIDSPYIIGVPLTEQQEIFVGRADVSARIEQLLLDRRRPPLLLYGQRRMGKTSLLNNLGRLLPSTIIPLFVDLQGPPSLSSDHVGLLFNLARGMIESAQRQRGLNLPPLSRDSLDADPFTRFDEWLSEVEAALGQSTALLTLDEFEALDGAISKGRFDEERVFGMLRNLIQHRPRFKVLLAGSHMLEELHRWASYLINVQVVRIGYLTETEARQLVERPVTDFALGYELEASQRVLSLTRGHPFLVQLLCAEIVALKNEQKPSMRRLACQEDVEEAALAALRSGSLFFVDIQRNQINATGLALLRFLAAQGEGATVDSDILSLQCAGDLNTTLDLLVRRELIEPFAGGYRYQVELIRRWFAQSS